MNTPVLALPNFQKTFVVQADASNVAVGAVLIQDTHPVAYFSKQLTPKLQSSSTYNRELYAVVSAVQKWRPYLLDSRFIIQSDHQPLKALWEQTIHTPEQQRWITKLLGFDFEIQYRPGKANTPADALSRIAHAALNSIRITSSPVLGILQALRNHFATNVAAQELLTKIRTQPDTHSDYSVRDGLVLFKNRLLVPDDTALASLIIQEYHDTPTGGHNGVQRTIARLAANFYWPKMRQQVRKYVNQCITCLQAKPLHSPSAGLLQPLPIPNGIWEDISMDFITGLPPSHGKTVLFVVVDRLSKYAHFIPLPPHFTASSAAEIFVKEVVRLHGFPSSIVSDRDPIFMSSFWKELFRLQGTRLAASSAYHPQSDGQTEVVNRCLEDYLRCFIAESPSKWLHYLPWAEWCYNTSWHSSTQRTPFEIVYGRAPTSVLDYIPHTTTNAAVDTLLSDRNAILRDVKLALGRAQHRMKQKADAHRTDKVFAIGDWVYVKLKPHRQTSVASRPSNKLAKRYFGPFCILERIGEVAYRLALPETSKVHNVFHVSLLKSHSGDPPLSTPNLPAEFHGSQPILQPQRILKFRTILSHNLSAPQVLIKWDHLPTSDATWESVDGIMKNYPNFHLEDKVILDGGGIVTGIKHQYLDSEAIGDDYTTEATKDNTQRKSCRVTKATAEINKLSATNSGHNLSDSGYKKAL